MSVLKLDNIRKKVGDFFVLNNVNFSVNEGEIYAIIGEKKSGKTTILKLILGIVKKDSGNIYIKGREINKKNRKMFEEVGYLVEECGLYPDFTVFENLKYAQAMRGIIDDRSIKVLLEKLNFTECKNIKVKKLSTLNKYKLSIAKTLIHKPSIILLDEPFNVVSNKEEEEILNFLKSICEKENMTILLTSRDIEKALNFANKIGVFKKGKIIKEIDSEDIKDSEKEKLEVDGDRENIKKVLEKYGMKYKENETCIEIIDEFAVKDPQSIAKLLVSEGFPPTLLRLNKENLNSYFTKMLEGGEKK